LSLKASKLSDLIRNSLVSNK